MNKDVIVIIPTLNPNTKIMDKFINELINNFSNIIIVNDGSDLKYNEYFYKLKEKNITVLKYYINYGKGRAIKAALNYIYNSYDDFKAIVTADCDGQHTIKDIIRCANEAIKNPKHLVLGCRDFSKKNVPFKSRYGNIITRNIFKIFVGIKITDTQTGLRAMSNEIAYKFLDTTGERFEYETKMLIDCKDKEIPIKEVIIDTVYIDSNSGSNFNPFRDSRLIYGLFLKYFIASISSFIIDIIIFKLLYNLNLPIVHYIILCGIIARIISSIYNYIVNKNLVFKKASKKSLINYYILVMVQMFVSSIIVEYIFNKFINFDPVIIKVVVDFIIFIINFIIQREWVFKKNK